MTESAAPPPGDDDPTAAGDGAIGDGRAGGRPGRAGGPADEPVAGLVRVEPTNSTRAQTPAPPPVTRRRSRLRRVLVGVGRLGLISLLVAVPTAYFARTWLASNLVVELGPWACRSILDLDVRIGAARVVELAQEHPPQGKTATGQSPAAAARLAVELFDVEIPTEGGGRIIAEKARLLLGGWTELADGVAAVRAAVVRDLELVVPGDEAYSPNATPRATDSEDRPPWPSLALPAPLPELPFPVDVESFALRAGGTTVRGHARLAPGEVAVDLDEIVGWGDAVRRVRCTARPSARAIEELDISVEPVGLCARGALAADGEGRFAGKLDLRGPGAHGVVELSLPTSSGDATDLRIDATVDDPAALAAGWGLASAPPAARITLVTDIDRERLDARGGLHHAGGSLTFVAHVTADAVDAHVRTHEFALAEVAGLFAATHGAGGELSGELALAGSLPVKNSASGIADALSIRGNLHVAHPALTLPAASQLEPVGSAAGGRGATTDGAEDSPSGGPDTTRRLALDRIDVALSGPLAGTWDLSRVEVEGFGGIARGGGTFDVRDPAASSLEATFEGLDLARAAPWLPGVRDASGRARGQIHWAGAPPGFEVRAQVEGAQVAFHGWSERLREITCGLRATAASVEVEELQMRLGGGTARGSGRVELERGEVRAVDFACHLDRVRLYRSPDLRLRGSGDLRWKGPASAPTLSGALEVSRGIYDRNIHPSLSGRAALPFDLFRIESGLLARTRFDVQLASRGGFLIRNNIIEVAPEVALHLSGSGDQPVITGTLDATAGRVSLPNITLAIERAQVRFPPEDPFQPQLSFSGRGRAAGVEITASATGPLFRPETTFRSTPELPEEDVLLLVATGYRRAQLEEQRLEQVAAFQVLRLYGPKVWESLFGPSRGESLLDRVTVTSEPGEESEYGRVTVEVRLTDIFSIAGERDERGALNLDVKATHWIR